MKSIKSWLLIAILVGLVAKNVLSFPANRAVDLSNDLLSEDTDADDGDDDDSKDDSKKAEIAKEGSGSESSKKTSVEEAKSDDSPEESSGNEENDAKKTRDASKKDDTEEEDDEESEDPESSEKKASLPKPKSSLKKRDDCCCEPEEEHCCHHQHEHENCCHNGCCCGHHDDHEHCHHENEDCCHHHGHHHGFCHEWGNECCGEHHGHECCGEHEHGHNHHDDHDHCHEHCHHCCEKHEEEEPECCCCDHRRSKVPVGYHCHDMVSKEGTAKSKRFCVPVYGESKSIVRSNIPSVVKKQTVHVGYGYASGDNYRLGYQEGGMGGLASSFTGQVGADHGGNFDAADHFNRRSNINGFDGHRQKRHFDNGHGYGAFNSGMMHGSATPYGHPVTHPGFTTMGFPGHALASQDVRNRINHPNTKVRRQAYGQEAQDQAFIQQQLKSMGNMGQMETGALQQMEQAPGGFPGMIQPPTDSDSLQQNAMQQQQQQEEMQGSMKSILARYQGGNEQMPNYPQMPPSYGNVAQLIGGRYLDKFAYK